MSLDLILEFAHHLAVFSLVGVIAAEFVLIRPGLAGRQLEQVGALDGAYGALATIIVLVGFARVIWGDAGWAFYVLNWVFWTKMALFVGVGLLSIKPTMEIIKWRKAAKGDTSFAVTPAHIAAVRPFFLAEFAVLVFIPIFAAMMARGIGL